ncbi:MAG: SRPBCC family protein [Myxococcaceae bacterium]|nr:SRPBCC family protein [Myxococcaceae bacterium]
MKKILFGVMLGLVGLPLLAAAALWVAGMRSNAGHTGGSIVIHRPAVEIWPYFTEIEKLKRWQSGIQEITPLSGSGVAVGTKSRVVASAGPDEHPFPMEHVYTAVEPPKRLAYTLSADEQGMGFVSRFQVRLDEKDGATTVTMLSDTEYRGPIPRLFEPLLTASAQSKGASDLRALKELVEGTPRAEPPPSAGPRDEARPAPEASAASREAADESESHDSNEVAPANAEAAAPMPETNTTTETPHSGEARAAQDPSGPHTAQAPSETRTALDSGEAHAAQDSGEAHAAHDSSEAHAAQDSGEAHAAQDSGEAHATHDSSEAPTARDSSEAHAAHDSSETHAAEDSGETQAAP